jgi:hypothetical protein
VGHVRISGIYEVLSLIGHNNETWRTKTTNRKNSSDDKQPNQKTYLQSTLRKELHWQSDQEGQQKQDQDHQDHQERSIHEIGTE